MGRHPCESCGSEGWDYSETYCPQSIKDEELCTYWDGRDICPDCIEFVDCNRCEKQGCSFCIKKHCTKCEGNLCSECTNYKDGDVERKVGVVTFPACGHKSCNGFLLLGKELDYCKPCSAKQKQLETQKQKVLEKQLEKEDAIVLFSVHSHFKSKSMKTVISNWLTSCSIASPDNHTHSDIEHIPKKAKSETSSKEVIVLDD